MESSRRELLNDMAERRSILKTNQNTHYSLIFSIGLSKKITKICTTLVWIHTQNRYNIRQKGVCFYIEDSYIFWF